MNLLLQHTSHFGRKDFALTVGESRFLIDAMLSLSHQYHKSFDRRRGFSVVSWAVGFEKVLEDPIGLKTFTEFLKREFSAENIKFWIACEHYRNHTDKRIRKQMASDIVAHHLCAGAPEPINIDSQTRQNTIQDVESAQQDLFVPAQKQIFNLMKFDCYQRFLKSELFAESLTAEKLGKPLPCQEPLCSKSPKKSRSRSKSRDKNRLQHLSKETLIADLTRSGNNNNDYNNRNNSTDENSQKEEIDEKKRKSLLPWQKGRGKSAEPERTGSRSPVLRDRNTNFRRSKRKTGEKQSPSDRDKSATRNPADLDILQTEPARLPIDEIGQQCFLSPETRDAHLDFCRVILPDASAAVLTTRPDETVGNAVWKLMVKHGVPQTAVEAYSKGSTEIVALRAPLSSLSGQELIVEARTVVRLQLPSKKTIAVMSRPERTCLDAIQPVLMTYGLDMCEVSLQIDSTQVPLNLNGQISTINGCLIIVKAKQPNKEISGKISTTNGDKEDEMRNVTNVLLEDIVRGRIHCPCDELGILDLDNISEAEFSGSFLSSSGDVLRRNSFSVGNEKAKSRSLYSNRASIHEGMGIKIQLNENSIPQEPSTTPRRNTTKNVHYRDSCDFTGVWNRTQKRLDDQRGTELNCELPEFLKLKRDSVTKVSESDL